MAMGTVWETGTWADGSWADGSWADVPAILWEQIAYYSDLHDALTIDGTSPLSLSGQVLSLVNDAAAAITEVDTGPLASSDTVIPTSKAVKTVTDLLAQKESPTFTTQITTPIISLTGGQIAFPATQNATSNANTLDDYEEGTWTPALKFGGNAVDIAYDTQSGYYTKIGRVVNYAVHLDLSSKGSSTGAATIDLPFNNAAMWFSAAIGYVSAITFANQIMARISSNVINLYEVTEAGSATSITNADFDNASVIDIAGMYMT